MKPGVSTPEPALDATFDHVFEYWPVLTRRGESLAFPLSGRFVKPGGFFKWFFYWDSYFALLGLVVQGEWQLAREIVEGFVAEVEAFGHVPNYNGLQSVCGSRSQSPFLTSAIWEVYPSVNDLAWLDRAARAAAMEYQGYWLAEPHLTRVGLSRYVDLGGSGCETVPDTPHYRAIGESGWDNTPRFGDDATQVVPVDLNCQLYRYELDLAGFSDMLEEHDEASAWRERADKRRDLINRYLWDTSSGFYWDYDLRAGERLRGTPRSLASFVPLWAGAADPDQASRVVEHLPAFEYDHGLVSCEPGWDDGTEHNYPAGWPYSHWYVCSGLRAYGFRDDATRIAMKWLRLISNEFTQTGAIRERHNVVDPNVPLPGRYPPQRGFAWTNGVFAALLARIIFGVEVARNGAEVDPQPSFPPEWSGEEVQIRLPSYPWPDGVTLRQVAMQLVGRAQIASRSGCKDAACSREPNERALLRLRTSREMLPRQLRETRLRGAVGSQRSSTMKHRDKRQIIGWIAVGLSTAITCFWAYWGIIENFHEGWYYPSFWSNVGLMFVQYLSPMLLFLGVTLISIHWPRQGGVLHVILALLAAGFFQASTSTAKFLVIAPLIGIGVLYWFGRPQPRKRAVALVIGLPLLTLAICGIEPVLRVSRRIDDGNLQARLVQGNGVNLVWAPDGPGWPRQGADWYDAQQVCQYLGEDGQTPASLPQHIWRLPTVDEAVRSMARHGQNSVGVWDAETAQTTYRTRPDKESPLWNVHSQVIYWWTATEVDEERAYIIVYDGKVWPRAKHFGPAYLGFRCVK